MRVELASEADFRLGATQVVRPSRREFITSKGKAVIVEPRVMQVLVVLARANGAVVSRDTLVESCWDGRIVGDDAINRVMSRLRRLAEVDAENAFRIETITRVGYRLAFEVADDGATVARAEPGHAQPVLPLVDPRTNRLSLTRRGAAIGGAALLLAGGVGSYLALRRSSDAKALEAQAAEALDDARPDQISNAIGLLRDLVVLEPGRARNWGLLASAYFRSAEQQGGDDSDQLRSRANEARQRALALDPNEPEANAVPYAYLIRIGRWSELEAGIGQLTRRFPRHIESHAARAVFLGNTGYFHQSAASFDQLDSGNRFLPTTIIGRVWMLFELQRFDEGERIMSAAYARAPQHYAIWFSRFHLLAYAGRADEALAMLGDAVPKPVGVPEWNLDLLRLEGEALRTRGASQIEAAVLAFRKAMGVGAGFIQLAVSFLAAVDRSADALDVAWRLYGLDADRAVTNGYAPEQGLRRPSQRRYTYFLFSRTAASLRAEPRFGQLLHKLGLEGHWSAKGEAPDFRAGPPSKP